jgi:hypothetical protein
MPMLITAERSHQTPLNAPRAIGVAASNVLMSIPVKLNSLERLAQIKKARMKRKRIAPNTPLVSLVRRICSAARPTVKARTASRKKPVPSP